MLKLRKWSTYWKYIEFDIILKNIKVLICKKWQVSISLKTQFLENSKKCLTLQYLDRSWSEVFENTLIMSTPPTSRVHMESPSPFLTILHKLRLGVPSRSEEVLAWMSQTVLVQNCFAVKTTVTMGTNKIVLATMFRFVKIQSLFPAKNISTFITNPAFFACMTSFVNLQTKSKWFN